MVRSSMISTGARSEPALSSKARSRASCDSSPVIWKRALNCSWIVDTLITSFTVVRFFTISSPTCLLSTLFSMNTTAIGFLTFSRVVSPIFFAPLPLRRTETAGTPFC